MSSGPSEPFVGPVGHDQILVMLSAVHAAHIVASEFTVTASIRSACLYSPTTRFITGGGAFGVTVARILRESLAESECASLCGCSVDGSGTDDMVTNYDLTVYRRNPAFFMSFQTTNNFHDHFRDYPYRLIGLTNAMVRPWKDVVPRSLYQASLGVMHTYFIANSFDYASRIDSTSKVSSFLDCYTWHCCASWAGPAMLVDGVLGISKKFGYNRHLGIVAAYTLLPLASVGFDYVANWYFYGLLSAGNKEKPRLKL